MATATIAKQNFENHKNNRNNTNHDISRQEIQAAIAKAVELRALHAALMQGNSPANVRFPSPSPASRHGSQFSAKDYPVFTPVSINFLNLLLHFALFTVFHGIMYWVFSLVLKLGKFLKFQQFTFAACNDDLYSSVIP